MRVSSYQRTGVLIPIKAGPNPRPCGLVLDAQALELTPVVVLYDEIHG
jgi:hypothetical protein